MKVKKINRNKFLKLSALGAAGMILNGCRASSAALTPTSPPCEASAIASLEPIAAMAEATSSCSSKFDIDKSAFSKDFAWGSATSSYQIEGAWNVDGKGESIWDRFAHTPGKVKNGDTGDIAADHYHRYQEDVNLMKAIGMNAYRFSLAWSRILPSGRGQVNLAGLDFYDRLVDSLLEAEIQPFVTLFCWDLPQALQDQGGWTRRENVDAFVELVDVVSRRLGDRVPGWFTINEPHSVVMSGYEDGIHAPGVKNPRAAQLVSHHLMLAHARAVPVLRENCPGSQVGIVINLTSFFPASASVSDRRLAWQVDGHWNRWYLDPLVGRGYPEDVIKQERLALDFVKPGDLDEIAAPIDFLGVNYYTRAILHDASSTQNLPITLQPEGEITEMGWEVYPRGLYEVLCRMHFDYQFPAYYITENGAAFADQLSPDGQVHDPRRISFMQQHFTQAARAIEAGVPLKGYFVWSLMDNFEWAEGYSKRFGLIYIDYATQERILKDSALWYRDWIACEE